MEPECICLSSTEMMRMIDIQRFFCLSAWWLYILYVGICVYLCKFVCYLSVVCFLSFFSVYKIILFSTTTDKIHLQIYREREGGKKTGKGIGKYPFSHSHSLLFVNGFHSSITLSALFVNDFQVVCYYVYDSDYER